MNAIPGSLQQRHAPGLRKSGAGGHPEQVNAAGHAKSLCVRAVPDRAIAPRRLRLIHQPRHFLTEHIVDDQLDMTLLRHIVGDGGGRVEGVGIIGAQREYLGRVLRTQIFASDGFVQYVPFRNETGIDRSLKIDMFRQIFGQFVIGWIPVRNQTDDIEHSDIMPDKIDKDQYNYFFDMLFLLHCYTGNANPTELVRDIIAQELKLRCNPNNSL